MLFALGFDLDGQRAHLWRYQVLQQLAYIVDYAHVLIIYSPFRADGPGFCEFRTQELAPFLLCSGISQPKMQSLSQG